MKPVRVCKMKRTVGAWSLHVMMSYLRTIRKGCIQGWKYCTQGQLKKQVETVWFAQQRFQAPLIPLNWDPVCSARAVELYVHGRSPTTSKCY